MSIGTSHILIQWILNGVSIRWSGSPLARRIVRNSHTAYSHRTFVDEAVSELLVAKAIRQVYRTPAVVSPLGVVPKMGSINFRLILLLTYVMLTKLGLFRDSEWNLYLIHRICGIE